MQKNKIITAMLFIALFSDLHVAAAEANAVENPSLHSLKVKIRQLQGALRYQKAYEVEVRQEMMTAYTKNAELQKLAQSRDETIKVQGIKIDELQATINELKTLSMVKEKSIAECAKCKVKLVQHVQDRQDVDRLCDSIPLEKRNKPDFETYLTRIKSDLDAHKNLPSQQDRALKAAEKTQVSSLNFPTDRCKKLDVFLNSIDIDQEKAEEIARFVAIISADKIRPSGVPVTVPLGRNVSESKSGAGFNCADEHFVTPVIRHVRIASLTENIYENQADDLQVEHVTND